MPFALRPRYLWRLRSRTLALGQRTLLMGILNLTPDSFSDGGRYRDPPAALRHALQMLDDGADLLDLGGESTRPNAVPVSSAEEQARVLPTLRAILAARPSTILSIDTYHAETARLAIDAGAEIVNDVSGHLWDPAMSATCAQLGCGAILMHTRGRPHQWRTQPALAPGDVVPLVLHDLEARADAALAAGVAHDAIVLDPGFGFGKLRDENLPLLAQLDRLHTLGYPILAGLSRKSFLTHPASATTTNSASPSASPLAVAHPNLSSPQHRASLQDTASGSGQSHPGPGATDLASEIFERELPTTVANTAAILAGAHILRVHDIRTARLAATLADRILAAANTS